MITPCSMTVMRDESFFQDYCSVINYKHRAGRCSVILCSQRGIYLYTISTGRTNVALQGSSSDVLQ